MAEMERREGDLAAMGEGQFYLCQDEEGNWRVIKGLQRAEGQEVRKLEAIGKYPRDWTCRISCLGRQISGLSEALAGLSDLLALENFTEGWKAMEGLADELLEKVLKVVTIVEEGPPQEG